jgi:hypothetical protein
LASDESSTASADGGTTSGADSDFFVDSTVFGTSEDLAIAAAAASNRKEAAPPALLDCGEDDAGIGGISGET